MMTGKFVVFVLGIVSSAACKQIYGVSLHLKVADVRDNSADAPSGHRMERLGHL